MERKAIKFKSKVGQIFYLYVSIMNPFLRLSKRESQVLAELLYFNYKYKSYSDSAKWKLVFHKESRDSIQKSLDISVAQFNNILTSLRKKKLIVDNRLKQSLLIYPSKGLNIEFTIENDQTR